MIDPAAIEHAATRIAPYVARTDTFRSAPLSQRLDSDIWIKAEHQQVTGSFKVRGAANFVHALGHDQACTGVVTASSGNHGIGVATAAASRGIDCMIFLPTGASPSKVNQIRQLGADIVFVDGTDTGLAETAARTHAAETALAYISPYNDPLVIAGQGTIGKEIIEDIATEHVDAIVVAVGGGGLISGIATWVKANNPRTRIIGASPANDRAMAASIEAGHIVSPPASPTLSDGTAGGIDDDTITFDLCRTLVDEWIDVTEAEIAASVTNMIDDHHQLIEGAAGVALAATGRLATRDPGSSIVAVSCGANISTSTLRHILTAHLA